MAREKSVGYPLLIVAIIASATIGYGAGSYLQKQRMLQDMEQIAVFEKNISELKNNVEALERQLGDIQDEKDQFPIISNLVLDFVRAHTQGDQPALRELLADSIRLEDRSGTLYAIWEEDGREISWAIYAPEMGSRYVDMVLQGYGYNEAGNYNAHIREFYVDENNEPESPPTFLNLEFQAIDGNWKVVSLSFDV